jgi:hypothetical protein
MSAPQCRIICDSAFLHGLKQLEIHPGEEKSPKAAKKKGSSKQGSKGERSQETEAGELENVHTVIKDFNVRDLQSLAPRLQPVNDMV